MANNKNNILSRNQLRLRLSQESKLTPEEREERIKKANEYQEKHRQFRLRCETFAYEYLVDFDAMNAYKRVYGDMDDVTALRSGSRLLKNDLVWSIIEQSKLDRISRNKNDADRVILRMHLIYEEAMKIRDFNCAMSALKELGKHYGVFEKHNLQKNLTQQDIDRMKQELEAIGFDFTRKSLQPETIPLIVEAQQPEETTDDVSESV